MDHRSGSASQGTSPLKAAGFLVGLLVVVALAFALGMKAGRELDVLRPEHGGETVKLGDPKSETKAEIRAESRPELKAEPKADANGAGEGPSLSRREEPAASKHADLANARRDTAAPSTHGVAADAAVGDEVPVVPPTAASGEPPAATPATGAKDYSIFRPTAAGAPAKATAASPAPDAAAKPSPQKSIDTATAVKEAAAERQAKAAAKPAPSAPATPAPQATASASALKIKPDAPSTAAEKSKTTDKASPGFVVQVAAVQSKGDADQLATRLRAHGAAPYINKVELPNGTWYRVRVGKFKTTAEAKAAQRKLAADGFRGAEVMSAR